MLWYRDWALGVPMLVATIVLHVAVLEAVSTRLAVFVRSDGRSRLRFILVVAVMALVASALHGLEATLWAGLYLAVDALVSPREAMLYSLEALTAYGHVDFDLAGPWRLLGAIEAVNGVILFGLTTAFLFAAIREAWPLNGGARR